MTCWALTLLLSAAILPLQAHPSTHASSESVSLAAQANRLFTVKLLKQLGKTGQNVVFSPFSISSAMALASLGARGNTRSEIDRALHFDLVNGVNRSVIHHVYQHLIRELTSGSVGANVSTASAFFGKQDIKVNPEFREQAQKFYHTGFYAMNDNPDAQINQWTAEHTNNMIKDIIPPGTITSDVLMVLINAIHFKGNWLYPFAKERTTLRDFYVRKKKKLRVPMMHMMQHLPLGANPALKSQTLELPYGGNELPNEEEELPYGDLSMYIILPSNKNGLNRLIKSLTAENLQTSLANLHEHKVSLLLPKFKLDLQFQLTSLLKKFGIKRLFNNPDLSGLARNAPAVSDVRHGAVIDVNEEGTEAAAATALIFARSRPTDFNVQHPFLFFIIHKPTDVILFTGAVFKP